MQSRIGMVDTSISRIARSLVRVCKQVCFGCVRGDDPICQAFGRVSCGGSVSGGMQCMPPDAVCVGRMPQGARIVNHTEQ
jgi:hypothetical protein